jgi:hypothetical protein
VCRSIPRPGLTRPEVVVLLVIFMVLAGLAISFLSGMRGAAQQAHCANNLRLIGAGILQNQDISKRDKVPGLPLPPSRIAAGYATWAVLLAPYVAKDSKLVDWSLQDTYIGQEADVREAVVPLFFCPARNRTDGMSAEDQDNAEKLRGAVGDYACASGTGDPARPWDSDRADGAMILGQVLERQGDRIVRWQSRTNLAALKRGLSNTILVGEKHVPLGSFGQQSVGDGSLYDGGSPASCSRIGGPGFGLAAAPTDPFNTNYGSYHPGVCLFVMADGSVRPMDNAVSEEILGQLINIGP